MGQVWSSHVSQYLSIVKVVRQIADRGPAARDHTQVGRRWHGQCQGQRHQPAPEILGLLTRAKPITPVAELVARRERDVDPSRPFADDLYDFG